MEKIDLYKDQYEKTGEVIERRGEIPEERYALTVFVCIFNSSGEMLIQQRSRKKSSWPGMWDISAGGAVKSTETSRAAAARETREELGLSFEEQDFSKILSLYYEEQIHDIYTIVTDVGLSELQLQTEEVETVKWASESEIFQMIKDREFFDVYEEFISLLFRMKTKKGILR